MLDLGFLEDVETILGRCPSGRQTALFSATMPPEIKKLAEKRMYDPVTIKVKAATLTIDTVAQFHVEVDRQGQAGQARRGDQGRVAHPGDHLRPHQDRRGPPGAPAGGQGPARQDAARRHVPGRARRRDDRLQGRARAAAGGHRRGRPRAGHRRRLAHRQLRHPQLARHLRAPHRPHGPRRETGRAITFITPKQRGDLEAIERHAKTDDPGVVGQRRRARVARPSGRSRSEPARGARDPRARGTPSRAASLEGPRGQDLPGRRAASRASSPRTWSARSWTTPTWTARTFATSACWSGSGSSEVPAERAGEVVDKVSGNEVRGVKLRLEVAKR